MPLKKETQKNDEPAIKQANRLAAKETKMVTDVAKKMSSPKDGKKPKRLPFRRFFDAVRDDVAVLVDDAIPYYHEVVEDGQKHITLKGNLDTLMVETPGLAYFYRGVRTDAQQIRRWLENYLNSEKAKKTKWFNSDPEAKQQYGTLKITEIGKYVDADDDIEALADLIRVVAEAEHRLEDLMEGFEERRITLSRILELRKENLKEVWIDAEAGGDDNA